MSQPKYIILLLLCFCLCGCHPLFCIWNVGYAAPNNPVKIVSVAGKYNLSTYSKKMMYYEGKYTNIPNSTIVLNADSTYEITNAPDWLTNDFGDASGRYFSKKGKWFLICDKQSGCTMEIEGIQTSDHMLHVKKGKMCILLTVGDGDSCQGMVYEKQ